MSRRIVAVVCLLFICFYSPTNAARRAVKGVESCEKYVSNVNAKALQQYDSKYCTALYNSFDEHIDEMIDIINEHIYQSFQFSVLGSHFSTDAKNRLGFAKYMNAFSDTMWNDAIQLVKYIGKRGGRLQNGLKVAKKEKPFKDDPSEIEALGWALDHHHKIAFDVNDLYLNTTRTKDAALISFLERNFVSQHADRIRELSGYVSNLVSMTGVDDTGREMALYMFDELLSA